MEMEYGKAVTYPQQDSDWLKKWGLAGLISIVPLIGVIIVWGYGVEISRRVIRDDPRPLPEWNDFGKFVMQGVYVFIIRLVYFLPFILVALCSLVPLVVLNIAEANGSDTETLTPIMDLIGGCLGFVGVVYGLVAGLFVEAAVGKYAATGQIGDALRVGDIWRLVRAKPGLYLAVFLLAGLITLLLSTLGVIACVVGAWFGAAYGALVSAHLQGQAYRYVTAPPAQ